MQLTRVKASIGDVVPSVYNKRRSFTSGVTISERSIAVEHEGKYWQYMGAIPVTIPAGTVPTPALWEDVGDANDSMRYAYSTVERAKLSALPVGAVVSVGTKVFTVGERVSSPASYVEILMESGDVLIPTSGFIRGTAGKAPAFVTDTGFTQFPENNTRSLQGVCVDARNKTVLYGFSVPSTTNPQEGGELYEFAFDVNTGNVGSFIRKITGLPSGHTDYFTVVYAGTTRKLLFSQPSGNVWSSGYSICSVDIDAPDIISTKVTLLDFTTDNPRALVGAWGNDLMITRVGIEVSRCKVEDVLAGKYLPVSSVSWYDYTKGLGRAVPEQNFQGLPEGDGVWSLCGVDTRWNNTCWLTTSKGGVNTSALMLKTSNQTEPEAICFYFRESDMTYQPHVVMWDVINHYPVIVRTQDEVSSAPPMVENRVLNTPDYATYLGTVMYEHHGVPVALGDRLAIGGPGQGTTDVFDPDEWVFSQWANNANRKGARMRMRDKAKNEFIDVLYDYSSDNTYGAGIRFTHTNAAGNGAGMLHLTRDKVIIGGLASKTEQASYKSALNVVASTGSRPGVYVNTSQGAPQFWTSSPGATLASTANVLRFGGYASATDTFSQYLEIKDIGYTWNVPATSDRRLKENFEFLKPEDCLSRVAKLRPVDYDRIRTGKRERGMIAQEANKVDRLLGERNSGVYGIHYNGVTADLVGATKALHARIEKLEALILTLTK